MSDEPPAFELQGLAALPLLFVLGLLGFLAALLGATDPPEEVTD